MKKLIKGILILVVIIIVVVVASSFLKSKKSSSTSGLESTTGATANTLPGVQNENTEGLSVSDQFLRLLLSMQDIELDQSIFVDPAFTNLKDFSVQIIPRNNEGRVNPFAPVGKDTTSLIASPQSNTNIPVGTQTTTPNQ